MDTNEAASWLQAEKFEESRKQTIRKLKNIKWTCPKCRNTI